MGVNYASSKDAANQLVTDIKSEGRKAVAVKATIANKADIENLFAETEKIFGRLDILVNDAGIYEFVPLDENTEEHFHRYFDLIVCGLLLACKEAVRHFRSGRQHYQHQLGRKHCNSAKCICLQRHQGSGRWGDELVSEEANLFLADPTA